MPNEILFPTSPVLNEVFEASNSFSYQWDGEKWNCITTTNIGSTTIVTGGDTLREVSDILSDFNAGTNFGNIVLDGEQDNTAALAAYYTHIPPMGTGFYPPGLLNISTAPSLTKEVLWNLQGTTLDDGVSVPELPGLVRTFVGHGELIRRTTTTSTDRAVTEFSKVTSHSGGSSSTVNATVRATTVVNSGASDSNVGFLSVLSNNGTGNNSALLINSNLTSAISSGTHSGAQIVTTDLSGGATNIPFSGLVINVRADGADTNSVRGGMGIFLDAQVTPGNFVQATYGIKISSGTATHKFDSGVLISSITTNNAIDISGATIASGGSALKLAAGQGISFTAANTKFLKYVAASTNALQYSSSGNVLFSIPDSGGVLLGTSVNMSNFTITQLGTPVNAADAATKAYVDSASQGLNVKAPAKAVSLATMDLNNPPASIDSYILVPNDRILLVGQTSLSQNGLYVWTATTSPLVRTSDANTSGQVVTGLYVFITDGTIYGGSSWILNTPAPITLGTTGLNFIQFSKSSQLLAGAGITLNGSTVAANFGTTANTVVQGNDARISGALQITNNLSDVQTPATARTNLGLGSLAVQASTGISVTGGTINNVIIGGATPAAGSFTTLNATSGSFTGNSALQLPAGTTAQQPGSATAGMIRFNSSIGRLEYYTTSWTSAVSLSGDTMTGQLTVPSFTVSNTSTFNGNITANAGISVAGNLTSASAITGASLSVQGGASIGTNFSNFWNVAGALSGSSPSIQLAGTDPNIHGQLIAKGNGNWYLRNGNGFHTVFIDGTSNASTINYLTFTNSADGSAPTIGVSGTGSTTTRNINYNTAGGGSHVFNNPIVVPMVLSSDGINRASAPLVFSNISAMTSYNFSNYSTTNVNCYCKGYRYPNDKGGGNFIYLPPSQASVSPTISSPVATGSTVIQLISTVNIIQGMTVSGTGIPANTYVVSVSASNIQLSSQTTSLITSGTAITITATANNILFFASLDGGILIRNWDRSQVSAEALGVVGDYTPPTYLATTNTTASGNSTLNFSATSGVSVGMRVFGQNVPLNTTVSSLTGTTVTMSNSASGIISSGQYVGFESTATDNTDQYNAAALYLSKIGGATISLSAGNQYLFAGGSSGTTNVTIPPNVTLDGVSNADSLSTISSFLNSNRFSTCIRLKAGISIRPDYFSSLCNIVIMRQGLPVSPPDVTTYASMLSQWALENGYGGVARSIAVNCAGDSAINNVMIVGFNTGVVSNGYGVNWSRIHLHTVNGLDVSNIPSGKTSRISQIKGKNFWSLNLSASTLMTWYVTTSATLTGAGTGYAVSDLIYDRLGGLQIVTAVNGSGGITGLAPQIWVGSSGSVLANPVATSTVGKDYNNNYATLAGGAGSGATLTLTTSTQSIPSDFLPGYAVYLHDNANCDDVRSISADRFQFGCVLSNSSPVISDISVSGYNGYGLKSYGIWQWNCTQAKTTIHDPQISGFDVNLNLQGKDGLSCVIYPATGAGNWNWIEVTDGEILPGATGNCLSIYVGTGSRGSITGTVLESYGPTGTGPALQIDAGVLAWKFNNLHPTKMPSSTWVTVDPTSESNISFSDCRPIQYTSSNGGAGSLDVLNQGPADRKLWPQHISFDPSSLTPTDGSSHAPLTVQDRTAGTAASTNILISRGGTIRSPNHLAMIRTSGSGVIIDTTTKYTVTSVSVTSGGSNYVNGDIIYGTGNDSYQVTAVSGGTITTLSIISMGSYSSVPSNPVSITGGSGTGATLNLTLIQANSLTLNPSGFTFAATASANDNSTKVATTAFVTAAISAAVISGGGGGSAYTLPAATNTSLGGVIVGTSSGLIIDGSGSVTVNFGSGGNTVAQGNDSRIVGALQAANNLLDISSPTTARSNLGLGTMATQSSASINVTGGSLNAVIIGATTPAAATFTNISITSSQTQSYALAAPSGSSGSPSWRQLGYSDITGLGSLATQASNSVTISGGTADNIVIGGVTPAAGTFTNVAVTGSQSQAAALIAPTASSGTPTWRRIVANDISGLGSMATQNASSVAITGGTISGITITSVGQTFNNTSGTFRGITTQTSASNRWFSGNDNSAEGAFSQTTNATTASGSAILNFASTTSVVVGMYVGGTNIVANSTVLSKTSTTVTISNNTTGIASGASITFYTNAGSNYVINGYNDLGSLSGTYLAVNRNSGNITLSASTNNSYILNLTAGSTQSKLLNFQTNGNSRWQMGVDAVAETSVVSLNTSAASSSGNALSFTSTTGVTTGLLVFGTNIPLGTTVTAFTSTSVTLSKNITGTVANGNTISFESNAGSSFVLSSVPDDGISSNGQAVLKCDRLTNSISINQNLTSFNNLLQLGSTTCPVQTVGATADGTVRYYLATSTASQTVTLLASTGSLIINCSVAGPISQVTIVLPPNPVNGQWLNISSIVSISSLVFSTSDGAARTYLPSISAAAFTSYQLMYSSQVGWVGYGTGGTLASPTIWNSSDKSTSFVLSNSNLTATSNASGRTGVRANTSKSSGKLYFEVTGNTLTTSASVGISNSSFAFTSALGVNNSGIGYWPINSGSVAGWYMNDTLLSSGAAIDVNGAIFSIAVDIDAKLIWLTSPAMRSGSIVWNNSATANPTTGSGGVSFAAMTGPYFITGNTNDNGTSFTLNAGSVPFNRTIPSGYTPWNNG